MSRWYDRHKLQKRMRRIERVQRIACIMAVRATEHLILNDKALREAIVELADKVEPPK